MVKALQDDPELRLVQSLYTSFLTPRYVTRKLLHATKSRDHFKYYVVRGSKYVVGHLLDFRAGQNNGVARDASTGESGVAELPVELFTAGGSTAPVDTALLESQQAEAVGTPG